MEKQDINFNYSQCIKDYDKLGEKVYVNMCNGEKTTVPWGITGYGVFIFFTLVIILLAFIVGDLIKEIIESL